MARAHNALYDAEKIAKFFGVAKRTAWQWCKTGKLPAFKIGKEWKIRVSDLQKMIDRKVRARAPRNGSRPLPRGESETSPRLF